MVVKVHFLLFHIARQPVRLGAFMANSRLAGRVVLVDDDPGLCRSLGKCLSPKYYFKSAGAFGEALAALRSDVFDLILLDINLGDNSPTGLDLLRELSSLQHTGAVCMLTGSLSPELLHEALLLGADDYLIKLECRHLHAEIERLVELGRSPIQLRPRYSSIADTGFLRTLQLNGDQLRLLVEMLGHDFPPDKELADVLGISVKALYERISRIESRFSVVNRNQLVRYLTVLSGYVCRSRYQMLAPSRRLHCSPLSPDNTTANYAGD